MSKDIREDICDRCGKKLPRKAWGHTDLCDSCWREIQKSEEKTMKSRTTKPVTVSPRRKAEQTVPAPKTVNDYRADPRYRFEERVKHMIAKGNTREDAEAIIDNAILKERAAAQPVFTGQEVRLEKLALGQHFSTDTKDAAAGRKRGYTVPVRTGFVLHKGAGSVVVRVTDGPVKTKSFVSNGRSVEFNTKGSSEERMAPDMVVVALEQVENLTLLQEQSAVPLKGSSSIQTQMEDVMAEAKKTAKKTAVKATATPAPKANGKANGEARHAGRGPAFGSDATVTLKRGPAEDAIKRHVVILGALKTLGGKTTVAALAKQFGKDSGTKQDPEKVLRMHTKTLIEGGFIVIA